MNITILTGLILLMINLQACGQEVAIPENENQKQTQPVKLVEIINPNGSTLETRIKPPNGFQRVKAEKGSYANYLRNVPLKPHGSRVNLYNGDVKPNNNVYDAVVDLPIGRKDLHQCADAVMRLRAEHLWHQKQYDKIHFNFTNGFRVDYTEWMKGKRIIVKGNSSYWTNAGDSSNTYEDFWNYMEIIFSYAGTLSLSKELTLVNTGEMKVGDVFIQGGSPGHAVLVVDMVVNTQTNEKLFLLAQSYMPAQEIQILKNPANSEISPWYSVNFGENLLTPEWGFDKSDLKRFDE